MEWTTSFSSAPDDANGNGVTRRIPIDKLELRRSSSSPDMLITPAETPVAVSVAASVAGSVDGSADSSPISTDELKKAFRNKYRHVQAIHSQSRPSCLSHDAVETPSFVGFRNLMAIVLVASNLRLVIENIQKYGVLVCIKCHNFGKSDVRLGLLLFFLIPCHFLVSYLIELVAAANAREQRAKTHKKTGRSSPTVDQSRKFERTWRTLRVAHCVNVIAVLAITTYVVYFHIHHPLIGTTAEVHALIVCLKTASYALTNRDLRHAYLHPVRGELDALPPIYKECPYPYNITFSNLIYFWAAPTLVYQPAYPRTDKIRWGFVFKRVVEVVCLCAFIWFLSAQYAAPVLLNSLDKMHSLEYVAIFERLLKLSTISVGIWLAGFVGVFQSSMNALAEVTRFGDREFYEPWWNSESLGEYWRTWNKPVYSFFRRHVYGPLRARGWGHQGASTIVFLLSAFLHELMVGVPTHNLIGIAFLGMAFQLPLIHFTQRLERMRSPAGKLMGNITFWVTFTILGQPFAVLMYFYAWQAKYGSVGRAREMGLTTAAGTAATCPAV